VECKGKFQKRSCIDGEFFSLLLSIGQGLDEDEKHLMVTVAWFLWLRRNKFVFEGVFQAPAVIVNTVREHVKTVENVARRKEDPNTSRSPREKAAWRKPPQGRVKINWDATVDGVKAKIGMGSIVRDHSGKAVQ
jgi:hypothetical protein